MLALRRKFEDAVSRSQIDDCGGAELFQLHAPEGVFIECCATRGVVVPNEYKAQQLKILLMGKAARRIERHSGTDEAQEPLGGAVLRQAGSGTDKDWPGDSLSLVSMAFGAMACVDLFTGISVCSVRGAGGRSCAGR